MNRFVGNIVVALGLAVLALPASTANAWHGDVGKITRQVCVTVTTVSVTAEIVAGPDKGLTRTITGPASGGSVVFAPDFAVSYPALDCAPKAPPPPPVKHIDCQQGYHLAGEACVRDIQPLPVQPPPPAEKPPPAPQCGEAVTAHSLETGGGTATGHVTVGSGCNVQISLASYRKPSTQFPQQLFDSATQTFGPGQHTLSISLPSCIWQVDLARGGVLGPVLDHHGMYGARLLNGRQGGEGVCDFAPPPAQQPPVQQPPVQQPPVQQPPVQQPPVQQPPVQQADVAPTPVEKPAAAPASAAQAPVRYQAPLPSGDRCVFVTGCAVDESGQEGPFTGNG